MDTLKLGNTKVTWLNGGITKMDGGAMFGPVPKPLWSRKYPCNEHNQIELVTEPILVEKEGTHYLIDGGIGKGRLSEKQLKNFGASEGVPLEEDLAKLNLKPELIDKVLMTHLHFDHVAGLVKKSGDKLVPAFPNAEIIVERREWEAIKYPMKRTQGTYWEENWKTIEKQVILFDSYYQAAEGVELIHTGGHSPGHCLVKLTDQDKVAVHFSDILPTHAHMNPLWVSAFDDYPLNTIEAKEKWLPEAVNNQWVILFYHDAYYRALKFNGNPKEGQVVLKRTKTPAIEFDGPFN
ncbi:MAG: MBL fold metallo-hydrolase [Alkalibacterium sp.]|nr:MBL fold metallo-hydrolase [Alkalibacterium sp.]TVP91815.1 MAG: MBL fold metallo-hydrolase [Alkalibacterium sp.]